MSPSPTLAHIEPEVLKWARESAGYTTRQAADKLGLDKWQFEMIERGGELLTLRTVGAAGSARRWPKPNPSAPLTGTPRPAVAA